MLGYVVVGALAVALMHMMLVVIKVVKEHGQGIVVGSITSAENKQILQTLIG